MIIINDIELFVRGLAAYFGLTVKEFNELLNGDESKLYRFYYDYKYNHN